jgi:hypothetical protein
VIAFIDARAIHEPTTADEVLALYVYYSEPGDTVTIHEPHCPTTRDSAWRCRCTPQTLTIGARA